MFIDYFHNLFIKDWQVKSVCLALAVGLWFFVRSTKVSTIKLSVPLEIHHLPSGLTFSERLPRFTSIYVRGRKEHLKIPVSELNAKLDLMNAKEGTRAYDIVFDEKQLPETLSLVSKPWERISLEKFIQKKLTARVRLRGSPASGYRTGHVDVSPPRVLFGGPASKLKRLENIFTEPIDISETKENIVKRVRLSRILPVKPVNQEFVDVRVNIIDESNQKISKKWSITVQNLNPNYTASLSNQEVEINLEGPADILGVIEDKDIRVFIDLKNAELLLKSEKSQKDETAQTSGQEGEGTLSQAVMIPIQTELLAHQDIVSIAKINPQQIEVELKKRTSNPKNITSEPDLVQGEKESNPR